MAECRICFKVLVGITVICLILQIVGFAAPGWLIIKDPGFLGRHNSFGLWYVHSCQPGQGCKYFNYRNVYDVTDYDLSGFYTNLSGDLVHVLKYEILLTLALLGSGLAFIFMCVGCCKAKLSKCVIITSSLLLSLSAIFMFIPVGMVHSTHTRADTVTSVLGLNIGTHGKPYALICTALAGALAFVVSILLICLCQRKSKSTSGKVLSTTVVPQSNADNVYSITAIGYAPPSTTAMPEPPPYKEKA